MLAQTVPLVTRRRWPAACLAVIAIAFAVYQGAGYPATFASAGLFVALYSAGAYLTTARRGTAGIATAAYALLAVVLRQLGSPLSLLDFAVFYLSLVVAWLAGGVVRRWRAQEAERRQLAAQVAASTERARIARELHDVVTHHVTGMVVQADAAQFLLATTPDRVAEGLTAISATGRRALSDLRYLLGVLEATSSEDDAAVRAPTLGTLKDLVAGARLSGQPVELTEHGVRDPQPVDVELAAYRVVQEALTNAMRHAAGRPTTVDVHHTAEQIEVEIMSMPAVPPPVRGRSGGRGLSGLRSRVELLGGTFAAGPGTDGAFVVRATIPARREKP
ncbi:histidine kinase [Asanoa sp. NPDC050611]|uniref:sensor histidine kinase n=1 Tax=Asanoa sp. NPDC050611 TaxID=3157098 RepID=UPI00340D3FA3